MRRAAPHIVAPGRFSSFKFILAVVMDNSDEGWANRFAHAVHDGLKNSGLKYSVRRFDFEKLEEKYGNSPKGLL
jgi:hypothetical protein